MITVGFFVSPNVQLMSFAALTAFEVANACAGETLYDIKILSEKGGPVKSSVGMAIETVPVADAAFDTFIVTGALDPQPSTPAMLEQVRAAMTRCRRMASICTGAFVLAEAGLLDGRRATTHWAYCDMLARHFPGVTVEREPLFVHDTGVWTTAGVTAGIDLALALVAEDFGHELAAQVARWLVVFVRRSGGQPQMSAQLAAQAAERPDLRDLLAWISEHIEEDLSLPALARRTAMSVRNFARVFRKETGATPARYVERIRIEVARRVLESSKKSVEEVAEATGFASPEGLRRAFARCVGASPSEYRARAVGQGVARRG